MTVVLGICTKIIFQLLNLTSTDHFQQVEDYGMSKVAHDNWKCFKLFTGLHKIVFNRGDSSLECLIEEIATLNVW